MAGLELKDIMEIGVAFEILKNNNRREIMELVYKQPLNLSQISEKTGLAYKNVLAHVKKLKNAGLVITEKKEKEHGRQVIVRSNAEPTTLDKKVVQKLIKMSKE